MDGSLDISVDLVVLDGEGNEIASDFRATEFFPTTIEVDNQTISEASPIVTIKRTVFPNHGWQLLHAYDNLGVMASDLTPIVHGENFDVKVDMSSAIDKLNFEYGVPFKIFTHIHYDVWETGEFNGTSDTHVFSPAFDDPVLGNDSAVVFYLTINQDTNNMGLVGSFVVGLAIVFTVIIYLRRKSKN